MEDDDDLPIRSGRRGRIAALVLAAVFFAVPVVSLLSALAGLRDGDRDWGPTLVGFGVLAVLVGLVLVARRALGAEDDGFD
ncbi:MAG TPA: hypothetical protein VEW93_10670 [Acidimicrobiales bacterium]|nr:hypothetical protein [Acidimicrobiales bacterium]